jgi:CRP/FNR family transcriptional regulator
MTHPERANALSMSPVHCSSCKLRHVCLPEGLSEKEMQQMESLAKNWRTVRRGETLFHAGSEFVNLYALRVGAFKTVVTSKEGKEQVTGFNLAGDPLGVDGIYSGTHTCQTIALEDSTVCIIPFRELETLCRDIPSMQHHLHRSLSAEIVRESGLMLLLGNMSADQRVAALLLNLSRRMKLLGYSETDFVLRMTREDIGSYVGMKLETVSRAFSKFDRLGLIAVDNKRIRLLDIDGLRRM